MAFDLSFSQEFFSGHEGESLDEPPDKSDRPMSVLQALVSMTDEEWEELAREVFNCKGEFLQPHTVMDKIRETNTCTDLRSPVCVWIDEEGYFTVEVYDREL